MGLLSQAFQVKEEEQDLERQAEANQRKEEVGGLEIGKLKITGKNVLDYLLSDYSSILDALNSEGLLKQLNGLTKNTDLIGDSLSFVTDARQATKSLLDITLAEAQSYFKPKVGQDDTLYEVFSLLRAGQNGSR